MKALILTLLFVLGVSELLQSQATDNLPREYTNPEELISFDRRTPFQDAVEVLTTYAQRFENRFIIDRSNASGPIGVSLPAMHWKDALNYIMRVQNLVVLESDDILEIVTAQAARERLGEGEDTVQRRGAEEIEGRRISTNTREIRINATFFEGNKRALREIGVDWSTLTNNVPDNITDFITDGGGDGELPSIEFGGSQFVSVNARGAQNVSQNVFNSLINFGDIGGGIEVQALFSAFEADNLGQILATPSVKVMDGEEGRIQVGQDFSIKQRDFAGNVTDQFFSTGTILLVRPQIVEIGDTTLIYLDLEAERSSAQPDPVSTIINKQQANTHALLLDGESTVIAGLYRTEQTEIRRGIPILKDLPGWFFGLKYLFGYNSTDVQESELVVLLQAELEESLDNRLHRAFQSKGELLAERKDEHRNNMNYISDKSPVPPSPQSDIPVDHTLPDMALDNQDSSITGSDSNSNSNHSARSNSNIELKEINLSDIRPEPTYNGVSESSVSRRNVSDYTRDMRAMELQNVNGNHEDYEYYVIGGAFKNRGYADNLYNSFKNEGLDAHMLYNPVTGFFFVAYKGFSSFDDSIEYLHQIKSNRQPEAWLSRLIREERRLDLNSD
ncbi:hypothetical protein [Rhodohalobacter sp. SW132]|uniref:hypothetical protein n=1 Tax=Rhodohalobacter sp. SW132 TaxID=2293433 RepID=UPI001313ED90|nr:hypothetical protein [Rhodohalobacter sp. SW132]